MITEGSTEETETSSIAGAKPYNRLGEDLLRMFLEEINPDVTIDVAGRHIRAHKCILSSRCQYFAAILSGGWIESAGNVISLQGYALKHKYYILENCIVCDIEICYLYMYLVLDICLIFKKYTFIRCFNYCWIYTYLYERL